VASSGAGTAAGVAGDRISLPWFAGAGCRSGNQEATGEPKQS